VNEFQPGTPEWLRGESMYGERGKAHACLRLLLAERISTSKCLELLRQLAHYPHQGEPEAPWGELEWNPVSDPVEILRERLGFERSEDWERLKAKWREAAFAEALREPGSGGLASTFPTSKEPPLDCGHRVPPDPGADGPDPEDDLPGGHP